MIIMRNTALSLFFSLLVVLCFAQGPPGQKQDSVPASSRGYHELKLGIIKALGGVVDLEYERLFESKSYSCGASLLYAIGPYNLYDFSLGTFSRYYFGKSKFFFSQGSLLYYYGRDAASDNRAYNGLTAGLNFGDKATFFNDRLVLQGSFGFGAIIWTDWKSRDPDTVYLFDNENLFPNGAVSVGYRF